MRHDADSVTARPIAVLLARLACSRNYLLGIAWNRLIIPTMNFLTYMFWVFRESQRKGRTA